MHRRVRERPADQAGRRRKGEGGAGPLQFSPIQLIGLGIGWNLDLVEWGMRMEMRDSKRKKKKCGKNVDQFF